jgi:predicted HicB family RNase H-like nuclease
MVDVPKPPKRAVGKGLPPTSETLSVVMGNNTEKPESTVDVPMNLRVPEEFHQRVRQFALDHKTSVKKVTVKALEELMERMGSVPK